MRVIAFAPQFNTEGRHDATGAFKPEATRFVKYWKGSVREDLVFIDNQKTRAHMRAMVLRALKAHGTVDMVAFFCHGSKKSIQLGFDLRNVSDLAKAIAYRAVTGTVYVPLYCCDTARDTDGQQIDDLEDIGGDGGFADELRDALCRVGANWCRVDGHTTVGHTDENPNVRRFDGFGSPIGGHGGYYIISREKKSLWKKWTAALHTDYRFQYPALSTPTIIADLSK